MTLRQILLHAGSSPRLRALRRLWVRLRLFASTSRTAKFLGYAGRRFLQDDGLRLASGLSYASLLALVPLLAIALALLSAFPAFEGVEQRVIATVFDDILPQASDEIARRVVGFVENASQLTGPGILALAATAILLLSNIDGAFNKIWRVTEQRATAVSVLVYWALLTLGPLLLGASISLSSYAFAMVRTSGLESLTGGAVIAPRLLSLVLAGLGFALLFFVVPNRRVHWSHALAGGAVSAVLFELLKYGFALYLTHFPSYQAIYGALASVPIFLVWLFLSWSAVLLGAEVAAALPEWRAARARGLSVSGPGGRLALALALLDRLRRAAREGRQLKRATAIRGLPATPAEVESILRPLREAGFLARTSNGRWLLGRDLDTATLGDLVDALDLSLEPGQGWPPAADAAVRGLIAAMQPLRTTPVAQLLDARNLRAAAE
jgi:membrane protein